MDADRYARVRDLFLAADELPPDQQEAWVRSNCGDDDSLVQEVMSLLAEHDIDSARAEGERSIDLSQSLAAAGGDAESTPSFPTPSLPQSDDQGTKRGPAKVAGGKPKTRTGSSDTDRGQITRVGAQRTQAVPRYGSGRRTKRGSGGGTMPPPNTVLWVHQTRKARRRNSWWLLLALIIPTCLVGWLTYRNVASLLRQEVQNDLEGLADGLLRSSARFLDNRVQLVESWARAEEVRACVVKLVGIARGDDPVDALRSAPETDTIMQQLQYLSGRDDIKFVIWDRTGTTLSSWLPDRADVGNPIVQDQANGLARVFRGQSIIYGPERMVESTEGFVPETDRPVMAPIVPVRDDNGKIIAALLVRGFEMFDDFNQVFSETARVSGTDVYAVNRDGIMVSESPYAVAAARRGDLKVDPDGISAVMRVSEILRADDDDPFSRMVEPLTYAAARASKGRTGMRMTPYENYAGHHVIGAWRWMPRWQMAILVEEPADKAFAAAGIVRFGFLSLGGLLTVAALVTASLIARRSALNEAVLHPLSRYEILGELGSGGMGVVYRARHRQLGRDTALKVLRGDRRSREDQQRFDREARLAATLSSPHCVKIYDYGSSPDGEAYCVMEFLEGLTLYEVVARSGHQSFGRTLFILRQICDAIGEAHGKGLLHRDLKPQNVILSHDAAVGDWAVVFDFGLAKPVDPTGDVFNTSETIWSGTPMYMAPERFRSPESADPRSDIYAIGCIAYFLLSAHPPYAECDPESMFALILNEKPIRMSTHRGESVPPELRELVERSMSKSLERRFQSVSDLAEAIDRLRVYYPWTSENADVWWQVHGAEFLDGREFRPDQIDL
ncbi:MULTISPECIES: serine/threonine protein kinase [Crateriforma]|uniref:Serine/threonine-protein kinase PknB n=1 Tax=Crateriforma conspicua TaxID=2527996 RepID=A0A5C6FWD2_9PLAN|nr:MULTISPECIES: serine/threonine protein kinase [Crateriforma]TWU67452.1 Serine/threonine-protein kinase PknB [Crateriforma conspicua]